MARGPKGLDRLNRQIAALPNSVRAAMADSLAAGAAELAGKIRAAAPEDQGDLKASIGWSEGPAPEVRTNGALRITAKSLGRAARALAEQGLLFTVFAGDDRAYYARWVEYGTAPHSVRKGADVSAKSRAKRLLQVGGAQHPGMRPRPFFYPTIRAWKRPMRSRVTRAANKAAKEIAALR